MLSASLPILVLTVLAAVYGLWWTGMNMYNYYPVARAAGERLSTGTATKEVAFVETDNINFGGEGNYPEIDVFVPGYQEQDVIHQSIESIRETAYPQEKLNLTVLLEPDDTETIARVRELSKYIELDLITVPDSYPGSPNKPRALNYGFEQTNGDIVGIVDAENVVAKDLFDRVARAIVGDRNDYVQGIVDMVNEDDGWKNLLFRAEYGYWYRFILPAFKRLEFPVPLSGTTCFFRRDLLESISEQRRDRNANLWSAEERSWLSEHALSGVTPWDPQNVTEDFELGLQLWATDARFGIIDSVTKEESPQQLQNWMKQRTRWQKGKLFTFLDFTRHRAGSSLRERFHLLWQSFLPHAGPLNISGLFLLIVVGSALGFRLPNGLVGGLLQFGLVFLFVGVVSFGIGYWLTSKKPAGKKLFRTALVMLTVPAYWLLQWAADIRAFKQLAVGDLDWEKTVHENHGRLEALQDTPDDVDKSISRLARRVLERHYLLLPVLLLAIALRIPDISRSYWIDELYSVTTRGSFNFYGLVTTSADPHPPLYYLMLKIWMLLFGKSEIAVRSLSIIFSIGTIIAAYFVATELYDRQTGLIAGLLISVSTFQIQYAQTARMYTALSFFASLSMYFYIKTLKNHSTDNRFGYGISTILMLLTHVYGSFVLLGQLLHLLLWFGVDIELQEIKQWVGTQTIAGVMFFPWVGLVALPHYLFGEGTEVRWLSKPGPDALFHVALTYLGIPLNYPKDVYISTSVGMKIAALVFLTSIVAAYLYLRQDVVGSMLPVTVILGTVVIPFVIAATLYPMYQTRYTIVGFIALAIIAARVISRLNTRSVRLVAVVLILVLSGPLIMNYYNVDTKENWHGAVDTIEANSGGNTLVVSNPAYAGAGLKFYLSDNSAIDILKYNNGEELKNQTRNHRYDQIWVVTHNWDVGNTSTDVPDAYEQARTDNSGKIRLVQYRLSESKLLDDQMEGAER